MQELTADLEHAKLNTKGRKSLAPKCSEEKRSIGTDSVSNKLAVGEQSLPHDVKESGHSAQSSTSAGREEEEGERVQEAAKTDKNKENVVNVTSAKLVGTIMWLVDPCASCLEIALGAELCWVAVLAQGAYFPPRTGGALPSR